MQFPNITPPRERDQVIMDIIFSHPLDSTKIALFLSDITTGDGRYLEHFVFDPGGITKQS
jgi:hypothetical protein